MEDKLIEVLSSFGYPVIRQGSMTEDEAYPPTFFTIWNNQETEYFTIMTSTCIHQIRKGRMSS